jgi:CHRD domain-containing protein
MKNLRLPFALLAVAATASLASADTDNEVRANLSGFEEVHFVTTQVAGVLQSAALLGAISTDAKGSFRATINKDAQTIDYELVYEGLVAPVTQAHIHFGQRHTVGGIVVWLCQTPGTPAPASPPEVAATPFCPAGTQGVVNGTIVPAQVLGLTPQGFPAGDFNELIRAIRAGAAYANVHSETFRPGEIRGHLHKDRSGRP